MAPIYLDYAAATPLDPEVERLMRPYFGHQFYNPSAAYLAARQVKKDIALARERVAHWLGCKSTEIIFTAGVTESVNLALQGVLRRHAGAKVLVGATEHEAVLETAAQFSYETVSVHPDGSINLDELQQKITHDVVLVSLMYANNETGAIHPLREAAAVLASVRKQRAAEGIDMPLYFHTDAAQATNYLDLHVARLGVDLMSINGAKIYGPKQSGALYVKAGIELEPLIRGGGHERGLRAGTENVPGIIGFAAAVDTAQAMRREEAERVGLLRDQLESLLVAGIAGLERNGSTKHRLPNILNVSIPGADGERLVQELDEAGIQTATGAACSADDEGPSHVLRAMGVHEAAARGSLRLSLGRGTKPEDMPVVANEIIQRAH